MEETAPEPEWPWPRLLLLAFGSGLAMVGTYVIIYRFIEIGFDISSSFSREPLFWGSLALVAGVLMLSAPWFPNAPWWRDQSS